GLVTAVRAHHLGDLELVQAPPGDRKAHDPTAVGHHEVHGFRRASFGRDDEVALVLTVGIVDHEDDLALEEILDRPFDGVEDLRRRVGLLKLFAHRPDLSIDRSTYRAITSASMFTCRPGTASPSVVTASVCGSSATVISSPSTAVIVRRTPSLAIEPRSTTYRASSPGTLSD